MSNGNKALVILSGGLDSTTCLAWAKSVYSEVHAVTFNYGQRHKSEIDCAIEICKLSSVPHTIIEVPILSTLSKNALTRADIAVGDQPSTVVDGRNTLFITLSAILAKSIGIRDIIMGVNDSSQYADCKNVFINSMSIALTLGMNQNVQIISPLMWLDKSQVWELADRLGIFEFVRERTLTCYNGVVGDGCGECASCKHRMAGLKEYLDRKNALEEAIFPSNLQ